MFNTKTPSHEWESPTNLFLVPWCLCVERKNTRSIFVRPHFEAERFGRAELYLVRLRRDILDYDRVHGLAVHDRSVGAQVLHFNRAQVVHRNLEMLGADGLRFLVLVAFKHGLRAVLFRALDRKMRRAAAPD